MKPYNHEEAVVVGIEVRKHGRTRVREDRYRKSRGLKSVTFTLGTESPTPALGLPCDVISRVYWSLEATAMPSAMCERLY